MRRDDREVKNMEEIQEILDTCKVCRLGMADGSRIYIVPMNFGYEFEGDSLILYFHGAGEGRKLELIRKNPEVGIEMDCRHELAEGRVPCQYSYYYGSVIGDGKAEIVEEPEEKLKALGVIMKHQTGKDFPEFTTNPKIEKAVAVIRVKVGNYTCKCHSKGQI
ncbi:MAG: pyridoxamine 5'-phosphate oxidase family protein [Dorea sp.]|jgi:nitroimidazol reductase NimA-like FMN-containing flavoprotein (pyridoxamine 5'-phosphate oxidase superfamily)|nr:pyridoxamine 5'-phosphate oxidase family protein [Dorea sp.]